MMFDTKSICFPYLLDDKKDEGNEKTEEVDSSTDQNGEAESEEPISLHEPGNQLPELNAGVSTVAPLEADSSVSSQLPQSQLEPSNLVAMTQQPSVANPTSTTMGEL